MNGMLRGAGIKRDGSYRGEGELMDERMGFVTSRPGAGRLLGAGLSGVRATAAS